MSEKLKPCPFCGGEAMEREATYYHNTRYYIQCTKCGAGSAFSLSEQGAIDAWNTRAYEQKQPELKPCPFCGKIPQLIDAGTYYYVCCFNELCKIRPCTSEKNAPEEAISAWNTRPEKININGKLKACPMCGSEAKLIHVCPGSSYSVVCSNDECPTIEQEDYSTEQKAIDVWNTRAEMKS